MSRNIRLSRYKYREKNIPVTCIRAVRQKHGIKETRGSFRMSIQFIWSDAYSVGEKIDGQYKHLFDLLKENKYLPFLNHKRR